VRLFIMGADGKERDYQVLQFDCRRGEGNRVAIVAPSRTGRAVSVVALYNLTTANPREQIRRVRESGAPAMDQRALAGRLWALGAFALDLGIGKCCIRMITVFGLPSRLASSLPVAWAIGWITDCSFCPVAN